MSLLSRTEQNFGRRGLFLVASGFRWRVSFLKLPQSHVPSGWFQSSQHPTFNICWIICDANSTTTTINHSITTWSWIITCCWFSIQKNLHELLMDTCMERSFSAATCLSYVQATTMNNGSGPLQISWKCVNCVSNSTYKGNFPSHRSD